MSLSPGANLSINFEVIGWFLPQFEVRIVHSVRESFTTDTDTLQYTVTGQLMHDQVRVNDSRLFQLVGNDTTDEVRLGSSQSGHQVVKLFFVWWRHSGETTSFLTTSSLATGILSLATARLSWMVSEDFYQQFISRFFELVNYGVVQRVLVLLEPSSDVVWYLWIIRD